MDLHLTPDDLIATIFDYGFAVLCAAAVGVIVVLLAFI